MIRTTLLAAVIVAAINTSAFAVNPHFTVHTFKDPNAAQQVKVDGRKALRMKSEGELPLSINLSGASVIWYPKHEVLWKDVSHIEAVYKGERGGIGGGAPLFTALLDLNRNGEIDVDYDPNTDTWTIEDGTVSAYWGSGVAPWREPFSGDWESTGNVITDGAARWDSGMPGSPFPSPQTYADTLAYAGDLQVLWLGIDLESGWFEDNEPDDIVQMLVSEINFQGMQWGGGGAFAEVMIIPEPTTFAIFGAAGLGAFARRRHRG